MSLTSTDNQYQKYMLLLQITIIEFRAACGEAQMPPLRCAVPLNSGIYMSEQVKMLSRMLTQISEPKVSIN